MTLTKTVSTDAVRKTGRAQRKRDATGKLHTPNMERYYRRSLPDIVPGAFEFELDLLRPQLPPLRLPTVESLSWDDERSALTGSLTVHRPVPGDPTSLPIARGHLIRCRVRWGDGRKYQLWTMRCGPPNTQVDTNTVTVDLHDEMALLAAGKEDWIFRKTKARPHGWTAVEITMEVARRRGLKVKLPLPHTTKRMSLVKRRTNALAVLIEAWKAERDHDGRPFLMRMVNGELSITTIRRNPILYVLHRQIQTALIAARGGKGVPPTILEGIGRIGKGKDSKKVRYTEFDRHAIKLLGNVREHKDYGTVSSHSELRRMVKRDLAKMLRVQKMVTITHAGIPFIQRGDAERILIPVEGYEGRDSFVWCSRANHTVQSGVYTTEFDFVRTDLFLALERRALGASSKGKSAGQGTGRVWEVRASAEDASSGNGWTELSSNGNGAAVAGRSQSPNCTGSSVGACDFATLGRMFPKGTQLIITDPGSGGSGTFGLTDYGNGSSFGPAIGLTPAVQAAINWSGGSVHIQLAGGGDLSVVPGFGKVVG